MKSTCKLFITTLLIFLLSISNVKAEDTACKGQTKIDLGKEAANVKTSYEEAVEETIEDNYNDASSSKDKVVLQTPYFNVIFYNITENIRIVVTNDNTEENFVINYKDTDNGTYTLKYTDIYYVTSFSYKIVGDSSTDCSNTTLKTGKVTVPAKNPYSTDPACDGYEDFYACKEYVYYDTATTDSGKILQDHIEEQEEKKEEQSKSESKASVKTKVQSYIKKHKVLLIVIGSILLVALLAYIIIKIIIRRKKII